jgi:hypothetical protein
MLEIFLSVVTALIAVVLALIGTPFLLYELGLALGDFGELLTLLVAFGAGMGTFIFMFGKLRAYMSN